MQERAAALVEEIDRRPASRLAHHRRVLGPEDRLADARRPEDQRAGARGQTAAEELIELVDPTDYGCQRWLAAFIRGDHSREDAQATGLDAHVVVAAAVLHAAQLGDLDPPPLSAPFADVVLQPQHAVRD